ncbi:MAG: monovalent cation/H(+) antiporter subunit G [Micropruina sp.]|uniref:monovalent cation/H(+) antiporter subunit G n=1 Tax=Micropruina sp. TaxID=2737536 RepID=UPI0039E4F609
MTADEVYDLIGALFLVGGAFFCLAGALGLVRFPDILSRMHAATKPQVFGLLLALLGVAFSIRDVKVWLSLLVVIVLQILTAPVAGHLIGRVAYRSGEWEPDDLVVDELAEDLRDAGFTRNEEFRPERGKDRPTRSSD